MKVVTSWQSIGKQIKPTTTREAALSIVRENHTKSSHTQEEVEVKARSKKEVKEEIVLTICLSVFLRNRQQTTTRSRRRFRYQDTRRCSSESL